MKKIITTLALLTIYNTTIAQDNTRELVKLPPMMQNHMMANMRDHLAAINEIQLYLADEKMDEAAQVAENRLGMSSMDSHKAKHMSQFMPKEMAAIGTSMHRAASRFALKAEEGDLLPAYKALAQVTSACVACHSKYKIANIK